VESIENSGDRPVIFGRRDPPALMLAGDESSLAVAGIAVGVVRGLAEHADGTHLLLPLHDAIVGDVAPQQIAPVAKPHRALGPTEARRQAFDGGVEGRPNFLEAR